MSDKELILGCKLRSSKHEEIFFKKYYGYVMGISMSYSKSRDLAQEITNDSFLKCFNSFSKVEDFQSIKPWLRKITIHTAIDYYRKDKKSQYFIEADGELPLYEDVGISDQLAFEDIIKLLHQLPTDLQLVFNLYEVEGYSHKEIAEKLELTESSSRVYLSRAKTKLRKMIQTHLQEYAGR